LLESVDEQNPKFSAQNHIFIHTQSNVSLVQMKMVVPIKV